MSVPDSGLRKPNRYITTHNSEGKAVLSTELPEIQPWTSVPSAKFGLGYVTNQFPVELDGSDIKTYQGFLEAPPGLTVSGGTVLRYVDIKPGFTSAMHRTVSLDYGVVLEGEVELILDSGETRILKRGDTCVQRATNHAWRNTSETEWARMLYVLVQAKPIEVGGQQLGEDLGDMGGVRKSD